MEALVQRMLALLDNVEGTYTCTCGRGLRVGLSTELWQTKLELQALLGNTSAKDEERSRFAFLEVDE